MAATARPRRAPIRLAAAVVIGVVAVAGIVALVMIRPRADHAMSDSDPSAWQRVMAGATNAGESTVTMARQAFSLTFEPLPGVDVPSGSRRDIQSGSAALRMMIAHWSELTASEQITVLSYLPAAASPASSADDPAVSNTEGAAGEVAAPGAQFVGFVAHPRPRAAGGGPDEATKQRISGRVDVLRLAIGVRAGKALDGPVDLTFNDRDVVAGSAAYTLPHSAGQLVTHPTPDTATLSGTQGSYSGCYIAFNRDAWADSAGTDLDFVIAHELFHCFEGMFIGDLNVFYDAATAPPWVIEGGANWAAAQVVPTSTRAAGAWQDYLLVTSTTLFTSSYDAIGFWNHLAEISLIDTWGALRSALGKPNEAALAQTDGDDDPFLDTWASSLFRQPQFGINWQTNGPTMSALRAAPEEVAIDDGSRLSRSATAHGKTLLYAAIATDVVVIRSIGHVTLHNASHDEAQFGQLVFCAREEGCDCPPGSVNTAAAPAALGGRSVAFGITGSDSPSVVALGGFSLTDWCTDAHPPISKRPSLSPPIGNGSGGPVGGGDALCQEIIDRLNVGGLLNNSTMSSEDIANCLAEILANNGLSPAPDG